MIKTYVKLSGILHPGLKIGVPSWAITLGAGEIAEEGKGRHVVYLKKNEKQTKKKG